MLDLFGEHGGGVSLTLHDDIKSKYLWHCIDSRGFVKGKGDRLKVTMGLIDVQGNRVAQMVTGDKYYEHDTDDFGDPPRAIFLPSYLEDHLYEAMSDVFMNVLIVDVWQDIHDQKKGEDHMTGGRIEVSISVEHTKLQDNWEKNDYESAEEVYHYLASCLGKIEGGC